MRLFSYKNRPVFLGPVPQETLPRTSSLDLSAVRSWPRLAYSGVEGGSLIRAMRVYAAYMDAARDGAVSEQGPPIPSDPVERSNHLKAFGYFMDAAHIGCCEVVPELELAEPYRNPDLGDLYDDLAAIPAEEPGFHHMIAHGLQEGIAGNDHSIDNHTHMLVIVQDHTRPVRPDETAFSWLQGAGRHCAALRAAETAVVIANYLRALGYAARAHTGSTADFDLTRAAALSGAVDVLADGEIRHPYLGERFALAAVSTPLRLAVDKPLKRRNMHERWRSQGPRWWLGGSLFSTPGQGTLKNRYNIDPYRRRPLEQDRYGLDRLKRQESPSTLIDGERIPRVPKRADFFWRSAYGDLGRAVQQTCVDDHYVVKSPVAEAQYGLIGAMHLLARRGVAEDAPRDSDDPGLNARRIRSALHFLGVDMVGISAAPDWVWYSHDADGTPINPPHGNAITLLIDQGHETMEGASGDDWIASSQSMRAYLRGMFLAGIVAEQIRLLGYSATVHSVVDSDVLHTPLVVLSGLGEISRIGDIALNPFLGPRLKSSVITTDMPLQHDRPLDFGLQRFCDNCGKCARECPSGAISAGPKVMFNGYETWKPDVEKCTRYRLTNNSGAMCGRCMKTCPWNLEGLLVEAPFRWLAMTLPASARWLARLDDRLGRGRINPVKKWWWDLETTREGVKQAVPVERISVRQLSPELDLKAKKQTLACYPADMAPAPLPVVQPVDREAGIRRYRDLLSPEQYRQKLAAGDTDELVQEYRIPVNMPQVLYLRIASREMSGTSVVKLELRHPQGEALPPFTAGAHIDLVIDAPFTRQYSLAGDPADNSRYVLGILREDEGRGGSLRVHERLFEGAIVAVTGPRNHFPLEESAECSLLIGGGIGITPMLAMGHRLHALGKNFELHYCAHSRATAAFIEDLQSVPWRDNVQLHISDEGGRADLNALVAEPAVDKYLFTCGPANFMEAVLAAGSDNGWREDHMRREYFTAPAHDEYENFGFTVRLARSGKVIEVPAASTLSQALMDNNVPVITKCEDGLCGACSVPYLEGDVEHRDFVLSAREREEQIIACCSRAAKNAGALVLDL